MKIFIEGNIGSGKSTIISFLQSLPELKQLKFVVLEEPVEQWKQFKDDQKKNILDYFYKNPKRWGYLFQMMAFMTRAKLIQQHNDKNILMERSVFSDRYIFAKNCYEQSLITNIEWKTYLHWFSWLCDQFNLHEDAFIYLQTDPKKSYQRIQKRNRSEEKQIPYDYIKQIHDKHEEWFLNNKKQKNILILDGNIENSPERLQIFKKQILEFIATLCLEK